MDKPEAITAFTLVHVLFNVKNNALFNAFEITYLLS